MITIKFVTDEAELEGIKQLQELNLRKNIARTKALADGYLSADYSLEFLNHMHQAHPSIIALSDKKVVGYSLVAVKSIRNNHTLLGELFNTIDNTIYNEIPLNDTNYVVVGQLCVAKDFRGKGVSREMYNYFRKHLSGSFKYCITDVASDNLPSLNAHLSTGFVVVASQNYGGINWHIVLWDWNK